MMAQPVRILIADDHPVVRQGIRQIIAETPDLVAAGEATDAQQVLGWMRRDTCDLVLLDLSMPGTDGIDLLKQLRKEWPESRVLILTIHSEDQFAIRALKAGAAGYLTKESAPAELVHAVRRVVAGSHYISPWLAERLAAHLGPDSEKPPHEKLSDREYQILRMIAAGTSTRDIASNLSLSVKTVATYRARILEKMNMKTTAELAAYAVRHRLSE